MNKHIQKQMEQSFKSIPHLKEGFADSLSKVTDIEAESEEPLTGVGSGNDLSYDTLYSLNETDIDWQIAVEEHQKDCKLCQKEEYCKDLEDLSDCEWNGSMTIFTDGEVEVKEVGNDWQWEVKNDTITIKLNGEHNTFQVLKSPVTTKKGYASMCYPGQCELNTEGDVLCYDLPEEYKT